MSRLLSLVEETPWDMTPADQEFVGGVMSNLDHAVEPGAEEHLREQPFPRMCQPARVGQHSAWDFCGYVWFNEVAGEFVEEVWVHKRPVEKFKAPTLRELMEKVNEKYGSR